MAAIIKALVHQYNYLNNEITHPLTKNLYLMNSPWKTFAIIFGYLYFVRVIGNKIMESRKPFQLDRIIQVYNVLQVLACLYVTFEVGISSYQLGYSLTCQEVDFTDSVYNVRMARAAYCYFILKIVDLMDTVFFILRKKTNQISFLHIYHHAGMILTGWVGAKFLPGGQGASVALINSFVHSVMYFYYFLSNFDPEYKRNIWWKKHITQLQMFQFLLLAVHLGVALVQPSCNYPKFPLSIFVPQQFFIFLLFWDFYKKAYLQKKSPDVKLNK